MHWTHFYEQGNGLAITLQSFYSNILGSIGMEGIISEWCYKGTILQRNYRKMTISWSFSYNSVVKLNKKIGSHNITMLCSNQCYIEVCYKGTALYF